MSAAASLSECVAVVVGASRGAGRGVALALGEKGATVYVAARTVRGGAPPEDGAPGTIEDTAAQIDRNGGRGVPVPCDATRASDVEALMERARAEQGRIDVLVNAVWGGNENYLVVGATHTFEGTVAFEAPFWEQSLARWDEMIPAGPWAYLLASRAAAPSMVARGRGLIVHITDGIGSRYRGNIFWDFAHEAINRMAYAMAEELRPRGVACVALTPGFMRTERVLRHLGTTEEKWRDLELLGESETPLYVGRAVAALAGDPGILVKSGRAFASGDLAAEYGFTDVDGRRIPRHPAV